MSLVKGWDICDFCGIETTNFKCWWCRRYICENCESERITLENRSIGYYTDNCRECYEERKKYDEELEELESKY